MKKRILATAMVALATLSACATSEALRDGGATTYTQTEKQILMEDHVLAFARPSTPLANMPTESVVIVGEKNSYVLTKGATEFVSLINNLDAKYIKLTKGLDFYSANDGRFSGDFSFKYHKLTEDFSKQERQLFLQHGARECTTADDRSLNAQSFCFSIPLQGVIYPAANNAANVKRLSKRYPITIHTRVETTKVRQAEHKPVIQKLVLLPFALAFDVATLPFKVLEDIFD